NFGLAVVGVLSDLELAVFQIVIGLADAVEDVAIEEDRVGPALELVDLVDIVVLEPGAEDEGVLSLSADEEVLAPTAVEIVVALAAFEIVPAVVAVQFVGAGAAIQVVVVVEALEQVLPVAAVERIGLVVEVRRQPVAAAEAVLVLLAAEVRVVEVVAIVRSHCGAIPSVFIRAGTRRLTEPGTSIASRWSPLRPS